MVFAITGTFEKPKEDVEAQITSKSGKIVKKMTQKTNYLLVGSDPDEATIKEAEKLSVTQISFDELETLVAETSKSTQ